MNKCKSLQPSHTHTDSYNSIIKPINQVGKYNKPNLLIHWAQTHLTHPESECKHTLTQIYIHIHTHTHSLSFSLFIFVPQLRPTPVI